jgi:O-antigen/teichoic acid export membrane protein
VKTSIHTEVIFNIIRTAAISILSFLTFPYVTRVLLTINGFPGLNGINGLGLFSWGTAFIYYFMILARIGIPNIAIRECSKVKDDREKLSKVAKEFFIIQSIPTIISFVILALVICLVPGTISSNGGLLFILSLNFITSVLSFEWVFIALRQHFYIAIRSIITLSITSIMIFVMVRKPEDVLIYALITIFAGVLNVISNLWFLKKHINFKQKEPYEFKKHLKHLPTLIGISLLLTIYNVTDEIILGFLDHSMYDVAAYAIALKGINIIITIIASMSMVFAPRASEYFKKDPEKFRKLVSYAINLCLLIALPTTILFIIEMNPLINLIAGGGAYQEAILVGMILATIIITYSLHEIIYTTIMLPQGKEKSYLVMLMVMVICNLGLSFLFAFVFFKDNAIVGIALAVLISDILVLTYLYIINRHDLKPALFNHNAVSIVIATTVFSVIATGLHLLFEFVIAAHIEVTARYITEIITVFFVSLLGYVLSAIVLKEKIITSILRREDLLKD